MGTGEAFAILISTMFVYNFVLARFLGLCPYMGVSKDTNSAIGMGMAVIFVMTLASVATWLIYTYVLKAGPSNVFYGLIGDRSLVPVLKVGSYILVIAALVQLVELALKKTTPTLYRALGIYLPLITTNCAVMGVALLNTTDAASELTFIEATVQGFGAGLGFTLAMILMAGIRERLDSAPIPAAFKGIPIAFVSTSMMALAFTGFQNLI